MFGMGAGCMYLSRLLPATCDAWFRLHGQYGGVRRAGVGALGQAQREVQTWVQVSMYGTGLGDMCRTK